MDRRAVVLAVALAVAVRPFHSRERLVVSILRNRYRPMSAVQQAFCEVFGSVWKDAMGKD